MCKCVSADAKCKYSIGNMCKLLGVHWKLCSRLGRQCALHKNINMSSEKQWNDAKCKDFIINICKCAPADPKC